VKAIFTSGRIIDLILAIMVIEAAALMIYRSRTGRGIPAIGLFVNLMAGAFLLMAARSALVEAPWTWTAAWLAAALAAHIADLAQRWR
jgi:hypothetical protein